MMTDALHASLSAQGNGEGVTAPQEVNMYLRFEKIDMHCQPALRVALSHCQWLRFRLHE